MHENRSQGKVLDLELKSELREITHRPLSPGNSVVKNPPANSGDTGSNLGLGRFLGGGNGTPLHIPAKRIAWTEESGELQPMRSQRVRLD